MGIEIDFGRELGRLAFPDDITEEQAKSYARENYQAIRQGLIAKRQEELAAETEAEEKARFQLGQYGAVETALNTLSELPRGALEGIGGTLKGVARLPSAIPGPTYDPYTEVPIEQDPLYRAGQAVQEFGKETYPGLPGVRETVPAQIMAGIGSTVSTLPAAVIAGPAGAAISYGLQSGESAAEEADATINRRIAEALANRQYDLAADLQDRREQTKNLAFITTAPIGAATEGLLGAAPKVAKRFVTGRIGGIGERLAERLVPQSAKFQRKFLGVTGAERVRGAVEALATEGVQESAEQFGGNIAAAAVYDPDRGWLDGVAQAGLIGAASGGIVGGLVGSRRSADLANAAAEAVGGNPDNPLPRANATLAGMEDGPQPTGPIEIEPEVTPEEVLRMSQELGIPVPPEIVTPAPVPATPAAAAPVTPAAAVTPAPTAPVTPEPAPAAVVSPAAPGELEPDEQAELDALIEKEAAGTLTEDDSITLSAYRARLGFPAQPQTPTPSAVQEQGADEGVLRREEPQPAVQVELRQVAEGGRPTEVGGAEAEVTPAEVQAVKAEVAPTPAPTPAPAPAPEPTPEYTPARINKLFQTLKARATAVGKGLYEIKKLAPGQRAVLRTRFGGLQETDQFLLREKSQVTGNPLDEGFILRDKQEAMAGEAPRPTPAPAEPTLQYTDADFAAAPSREAAGNMAVTQVRTNPSLPPRPPQIFYTLEAIANRAAKRPYDPKSLTAELIKQAQDSGLLTAAKNPKLTPAGQQSLTDGQRQSQERKAAQANLSDALRERAVLAWDAANDPQSAAYKERIAARPAAAPAPSPAPTPTPQADPNEKLAAFIEDVDGAITNLESPAKLRAMVKKALAAGYITARDAAEIASVQKSMGSAEDTTDAFGEFASTLNMELEKRRKAPVATPAAPAPVTTPAAAPTPAAKTASELAGDLVLLRAQKPRPLKRLYGPNPTEKQKVAHKAAMSDWEKQYRKLALLQKRTLDQENANRTAKVREAVPGEPAQPPAAAGGSMQEGIDNLKFVSDPVAKVPGGGMDPKDAKAKLIQQLERALESAPVETIQEYLDTVSAGRTDLEERFKTVNDKNMGAGFEAKYRERHELGKKLIAKYGPTVPRITIEIPGDGTYTIANTKQAINQVLEKARSLNTSMAKGPIRAPAARQKPERAREVPMRLAQQAIQVYGKANAAAKLREQAANTDLELTDQQRTELKVAADMITPAPAPSAAQSAIDTIDKINKGLSENQYSDPLFLTPLAKLALQIAKSLIQAGIAVDQAIRQAIAQARQQLPNDPADDIQLADRLIRDAQYTEAVAAGDLETAQRMVDEAAKAAGYDTRPYYHGTDAVWTEYEDVGATTAGGRMLRRDVPGAAPIFVSSDPDVAESYGENVKKLYIDFGVTGKQSTIDAKGKTWGSVYDQVVNALNEGAQSVLIKNVVDSTFQADLIPSDVVSVVYPEQIKSADPITRDDSGNVVPLSRRFQSGTADIRGGRPDRIESALQKVIAATDPKGKAFEAITALSSVVIYQATKIALRIYQATKSWVAARNAGMDYIKSHVQLQNEPETAANFEEFLKAVPSEEIPAGRPDLPQPPSPAERVESRGLFLGEIERDTDENWASEARKWVDFYKGNLERAFQVALTADIDNAFKEYILGEIIQRNQLDIARAKNDVEVLRALNLEKRLAESAKSLGAVTAKAMAARKLAQERFWWAQPAMILRNLIRKRQDELIPFSKIESEQVRKWLTESGREAVNQIREAMKKADNVFAREFRKIKQVPGEPDGPPIEIKWQDILTQALDTQGSVRQKMLQVILADPRLRNLSPAGIAEITNLLTTAWEAKRNQIFRAEFQKKVPLPNVKPDLREKLFRSIPRILKYANIARATPGSFSIQDGPDTFLLWEQAFRDAVAPEFGVAELNGATARKITDLAQKAQAQSGVNRNEIIQQMFRLMAREGGVRFSDVLRDYWYAAVLSGIRTQVDNAMNVFNGFLNTAMFATMAKKDAGFIAYSALKGLDEGIRDFWPMLWRGELYRSVNFNPDQPGSALEGLGQSRNLFAKGISQFKYVGRLINALDHMTALMSDSTAKAYALRKLYGPEVARQYLTPSPEVVAAARARAIAEGTRPELVNKRTREIIQEKLPVEILLTAKEIREMTTFTETPQGLLGSLYRGLDQAAQGKTLYKVLSGTNFLRFAANSANEILNFAFPVALYRWYQSAPGKSEGEYGLKFSESRRDLILAKAAFGTALGIFAGALFLGDDDKEEDRNIDITGSFKSLDPNKRKQLLAEGRQPYSIRFGNTYVSYRQLGFGGVLATIGELRDRQLFSPDKWSQENIIEKILDGAAAGMFIVKDSTAISGLTELLGFANAYKYDTDEFIEKSFPRYVSRLAGSLVPNILKEVDAWSDPSIFKTEAGNLGYEYFLQQVPFGRREIGPGPILNVLGEPVKVERYPWSRWAKEREDDLAWSTLGKLASRGVFMPTPAITVKVNENGTRRELTREEKYQYQQAVGQGYRKFIEQNSNRLLALPPAEAADFIDKNADRIRRTARTNLKNSF